MKNQRVELNKINKKVKEEGGIQNVKITERVNGRIELSE